MNKISKYVYVVLVVFVIKMLSNHIKLLACTILLISIVGFSMSGVVAADIGGDSGDVSLVINDYLSIIVSNGFSFYQDKNSYGDPAEYLEFVGFTVDYIPY